MSVIPSNVNSHDSSRLQIKLRTCMGAWHHVLDLVREFRFFTSGSSDCFCTSSLLILASLIAWVVGFWTGCILTICCVSPRFRNLLLDIVNLILRNYCSQPAREPGQAIQLRERLREYRAWATLETLNVDVRSKLPGLAAVLPLVILRGPLWVRLKLSYL